jgi:AcrR family transcriptional regulator
MTQSEIMDTRAESPTRAHDDLAQPSDAVPEGPLTRRETQARTRASILTAAAAAFSERGYSGCSVSDIANDAGFTTGALYSNFANKDDLFLAVVDQMIEDHLLVMIRAYDAADTPEEGMSALVTVFADGLVDRFQWNLAMMEFSLRARERPEIGEALGERHRRARDGMAAAIGAAAEAADHELPGPTDLIASEMLAIGPGLMLEHLLDPTADSVAVYRYALFTAVGLPDPDAPKS